MLTDFQSQKFKFWSFISMILLVFVHGYNLQERYMEPWTLPMEPMSFTAFTEYFLANGIFRFRIPMLFIISGFLYAMHDNKPYKERTNKRLTTLLLPYLIWSCVGFLAVYLFEMLPYTKELIRNSHIVQIDNNRFLIHDYTWYESLARIILLPVPYQLWFIRVLLIYNVAYPAIKWCIFHPVAKWIFFGFVFLLWLITIGLVLFEGEGLLFFSLGILIQKTNFDIEHPKKWLNPWVWGILFMFLTSIKTWLAFNGEPLMGNGIYPLLAILHKLVIISGLITAWFGCNALVRFWMNQKWFVWLSAFSFMIYVIHAPLVAIAIDAAFELTKPLPMYRMVTFIGLPLVVIAISVLIGLVIRSISPKLYGILTGGRGF